MRRYGLIVIALAGFACPANETKLLWEIGQADHKNAEFALAPKDFKSYHGDICFIVGRSDSKQTWPYVHPGPADGWAGGSAHTFSVVFGTRQVAARGSCRLIFDLLDTHSSKPPHLKIDVNGKSFEQQLPAGAGDESVNGAPEKGKAHQFSVDFPADLLSAGNNRIDITSDAGSWLLYDRLALETPAEFDSEPVENVALVRSVTSQPALIERQSKLYQSIIISLFYVGDPVEAGIWVGEVEISRAQIKPGEQKIELLMPEVKRETELQLSLRVRGSPLFSRSVTLKPVRKFVFYILPHSHVDIGYTHLQPEIERKQMNNIAKGIAMARSTASYPEGSRFKWNVEVLWAVESYLKSAPPEQQEEFFQAVKSGWIGLDALYLNELTGLCRPEELIRLLRYSSELARRSGIAIDSAMISDVPGYTWGTVSTLAQAGVKYFSIGPNYLDRIGTTLVEWENKPFYWLAPNGRDKVLCWVPYRGYALSMIAPEVNAGLVRELSRQLEKNNYPYDIAYFRWAGHGDNAPPDEKLAESVKKWNSTFAFPKLVIATTGEAFREFDRQYGARLPTVSGDWTPYWEDGAGSSAHETALNRNTAERLVQAETLWALLNPRQFPSAEFHSAWRNVLLYSEHTWGAHNSISHPDLPFVKEQWKIKQAYARDADAQSRKLLVDCANANQTLAIDVFNTSSWPRTELVVLSKAMSSVGDKVLDSRGRTVASQRLTTGELAFLAQAVAPFSAQRFTLAAGPTAASGKAAANGTELGNGILKVNVNGTTGAISGLRIHGSNVNLVDTRNEQGLNEFLYLPGSDLKNLQRNGPVTVRVKEVGPVVASLLIESDAPGCNKLSRELMLVDGLDRLSIVNILDKKAVRTKEGVHFGFAFNVPDGAMRMDVSWAIVRPEIDQMPGACKNWFAIQRWVDISNNTSGVTWAPLDAPLVEMGAITANLLGSQTNPASWRKHVEPSQTLYSWALNNHWHTNYKADQDGRLTFRYCIRPHHGYLPDEAWRFGVECSQPLQPMPAVNAMAVPSRLRFDAPGVFATALKPADNGKALILRLFNVSNKESKVHIDWNVPVPSSIFLSDGSETAISKITGPIIVPGLTIVTLRAEFEP